MSKKKTTTSIPKNPTSKKELLKKAKKSITEGAVELSKSDFSNFSAEIKTSGITQCIYLLAIDQNEGWKRLSYSSMKEFMEKTFPKNYDALNRNLVAARVAHRMGGVDAIGTFSDNALQPLNTLSATKCKQVIKAIKKRLADDYSKKKVTKKLVLEAMYELDFKAKPDAKAVKPKDTFASLAETYKENPKKFIPVISDTLLNNMERSDISELIKKLKAGMKKK